MGLYCTCTLCSIFVQHNGPFAFCLLLFYDLTHYWCLNTNEFIQEHQRPAATGSRCGSRKASWHIVLALERSNDRQIGLCYPHCFKSSFRSSFCIFFFPGHGTTGYCIYKRCQKWKVHQNAKGKFLKLFFFLNMKYWINKCGLLSL